MADETTRPVAPAAPEDGSGTTPARLWRELLGEQLRTARRARGETLHGVARRASMSPQYLSELERGMKEPSSEMIAALGTALGLTLLDLTVGIASRLYGARTSGSRGGFRLAA